MPKWDGVEEPIGEIYALKRQDFRDIAQETLEKVYRYVLPVMKKHKYRVHKLCEFLPRTQNLLGVNVNHGQKISLRLRYHHNPREFLPFESVLGTMLHELCHNTYGPHNNQFFALLDELTQEMEGLIARGFTGDPFIGSGQMVGGQPLTPKFVGNNPYGSRLLRGTSNGGASNGTLASAGSAGSRLGGNLGTAAPTPYSRKGPKLGKGRKLGGLGVNLNNSDHKTRRELVLQAAERRRQAEIACRSVKHTSDLTKDEQGEVIDLTAEDEDESNSENGPHTDGDNTIPRKQGPTKPEPEIIYLLDDD